MQLYFTRHGESEYNTQNRIGGDSSLTGSGMDYAQELYRYVSENDLLGTVFCSPKRRTMQTIEPMQHDIRDLRIIDALVEISAGVCENETYDEVSLEISNARGLDKLNFRYPGGESYVDLIERVGPVCAEIKKLNRVVLVVCHRAVIRAMLFYFASGVSMEDVPHIPIPLHTIIMVEKETGEIENIGVMK